jgi:hypothetical protein
MSWALSYCSLLVRRMADVKSCAFKLNEKPDIKTARKIAGLEIKRFIAIFI